MTVKRISFVLLALLISTVYQAQAQTINAASCNSADVQTAFNAVTSSTTTVNIPAGTCTWTSSVSLTVPSGNTSLSILGAGNLTSLGGGDATVIIDNYASNSVLISVTTGSASSFLRFAGITLQGGTGLNKQNGVLAIYGNSQQTRVDHNHFNLSTYATSDNIGFRTGGWVYGVFDHNLCDDNMGVSECINVWTDGYGGYSNGDGAWADSTGFGTNRFMYVEANTFNQGTYTDDCDMGGREVFRFNTVNQAQQQTHPTGSSPGGRGCRAKEVYLNTVNGSSACNSSSGFGNCMYNFYWYSSGPSLIFENSIPVVNSSAGSGYQWLITIHSMRSDDNTYHQTAPPGGWGYCGTQVNGTGSAWDQNTNTTTGYPCLDQPGRGQGDLLQGDFVNDGGSNNKCDVTTGQCAAGNYNGSWPNEALEPMYEWLDSINPVPNNPGGVISVADSGLTQNQDYYLYTSNFTGASGVGSGTLASRPSTCTAGVAYWATDQGNWNQSGSGGQGELFKCTATNTWTLYYTPYTYPHPLDTSTSACTGPGPCPASGLQAVFN
jgi:hypothetical protein